MPNPVKAKAKRRRAVYKPRASVIKLANHTPVSPQALLKNFMESVNMSQAGEVSDEFQELVSNDDSADYIYSERKVPYGAQEDRPLVPDLFTSPPPIQDFLKTETSVRQDYTVQECLPFLAGLEDCGRSLSDYNEFGVPRLDRDRHIRYLHDSFDELPARFVAFDASRPWLLYWALTGLSILGEEVKQYRQRWYIKNFIIN
jgi:protein farnesyltransferase subunit beta